MEESKAMTELKVIVVELKVKLEAFICLGSDLKKMLTDCQVNCLHNREGIYNEINTLRSSQDRQSGAQDVINKQKMLKPHWHLGASTWLLVLVAFLQLIVLIKMGVHP